MPKPNAKSRSVAVNDMEDLDEKFTRSRDWNFSDIFEQEDCSTSPLDCAKFDTNTRRFQSTNDCIVKADDFIAQAMVMLILYRLDHGVGFWKACRQLSILNNDDQECTLENFWDDEIQQCIQQKRLGPTTLHHQDNFDGFRSCYSVTETSKWQRRYSGSFLSVLHEFAEQAAIQWALNLIKDERYSEYPFLAASMIRLAKTGDQDATSEFALLLHEAAKSSDSSDDYFGKIAVAMMCNPPKRSKQS